jgi:uncharacterized RDD family membrane protein YckC
MQVKSKITIISLSIAILGLLSALLQVNKPSLLLAVFLNSVNSLRLGLFNSPAFQIFINSTETMSYSIETLNIFVFLLLLIGVLLYWISKGKETRLLRFVISIVLLSSFVNLGYSIFRIFYYGGVYPYWYLFLLFGTAGKSVFIYYSFYILNHFQTEKKLVEGYDNSQKVFKYSENEASNWQRLVHLLIDTFICLSIFSFMAFDVFKGLLNQVYLIAGEKASFFVFYLIISLIYYLFFEYFFGATPAKMLTELRVVNEKGEKPNFKSLVVRSLSRRIPFDSISFFSAQGWHDQLSKTKVIQEKRTGIKGVHYVILLTSLILMFVLFLIGQNSSFFIRF